MIYTCAVCSRELASNKDNATEEGNFPPVVSYCLKMEDSFCCADCVSAHDGLGKFEAHSPSVNRSTRGDLARALILHAWTMGGMEDDRMYQEGWGYCAMFGRYLVVEDDRGFFTFEEFDTVEKAQKEFDRLYSDGWGASEDDAYISFDRGLYEVSFNGKHIGTFERESRARAAISLAMRESGYYPSVWIVNDHGNISEASVW